MRKHRPGRSLEGGVGHFTLTLPFAGKGLGSLSPEQGPDLIHHPEKSPLETPSLLKTVASRCLALSSGTVQIEAYKAGKGNSDAATRRVQKGARAPVALSVTGIGRVSRVGMGGGGSACWGGAGSVTSVRAGVPQRCDVFGHDTCVCMYIWVPSHTSMNSLLVTCSRRILKQ